MSIFGKLGWYFKREKKRYLIGISFLLLVALVNLIPPRVIGILVDAMGARKLTIRLLVICLILLAGAGVGQYLFRYGWRNQIWGGAAGLEKTLRSRLFWHFMQMDATFFQKHRTGDLMAHATNDLNAVQNVAGSGILTFADSIITGVTTIIAMVVFVDWRLTLVAIIPMPLLAVASRRLGMKLHAAFGRSQAAFSHLNDKAQESISGIKVIKTFGQEKEDVADFDQMVDKTIRINRKVNFIDGLFDPVMSLIIGLTYIVTIIYGSVLIDRGVISIGQLISFVSYIGALNWPMFAVGRLFNIMERGNASYDRVDSLLQEHSEIVEADHGIQNLATGDMDFQVDHFQYPDDDQVALKDIKFHLKQGATLGIVGRVGSGKSSIVKLLLREFDHYTGHIQIGGQDIKKYSLDALLDAIGYVPQDNFLFSTNIADNVRFGDYSKSQQDIEQAAKVADIDREIKQFSEGYQTLVGERGVSLSGGQKQRLAIARAVITNPEILILDDSLSAVDGKTEAEILHNLKTNRNDKTTIIIAQRLSSVMNAEEILVIDNGRVTERGNHTELLAKKGWYAKMWNQQQLAAKIEGEN